MQYLHEQEREEKKDAAAQQEQTQMQAPTAPAVSHAQGPQHAQLRALGPELPDAAIDA